MINSLNIAFITDNSYVMQTYIAIMSLIDNKNKQTSCNIYVITMNVTTKNQEMLKILETKDCSITIIEKNSYNTDDLGNEFVKRYYSPAIFLKLELEKIFPNISKLLFLDCDIIIKKDLSELYNTDINDYYIAGCKDVLPTFLNLKTKNKKYENYFNVGVMLLNLDLIRKDNFFEKASRYYMENGKEFTCPEQDTLNDIIEDKLKIVSPVYNWITTNKRYTKKQLVDFYNLKSAKEIREDNITIFHYAGIKPWKYKQVYYGKYWNEYYQKSVFKNQKLNKTYYYNFFVMFYLFFRTQYRILKNYNLCKKIGLIK